MHTHIFVSGAVQGILLNNLTLCQKKFSIQTHSVEDSWVLEIMWLHRYHSCNIPYVAL